MKKAKSKGRRILIILVAVLLLAVCGWGVFSVSIYKENFDRRYESYEPLMLTMDDYYGLARTEYRFPSDKGQLLTGYYYHNPMLLPYGIVVLAHGLGAGHNSYMDLADYFVGNGYDVFAYDATACDESEGTGLGGIPQGVIDLDYAISFVEENPDFEHDVPILLFGHSWGGYSVCSVLNYHPEVKAVIECAGCNRSSDLFEAGGRRQAGNLIYTMMPFVNLYERVKFGKYAKNTAMDGFAASDAAVMIVHSADDGVVPTEYGYDLYYETYKDDPRFTFLRLEDRGHNYIYDDTTYLDAFNDEMQKWAESLDYDRNAEENKERFAADKADYIKEHLDRNAFCRMLDSEIGAQFIQFYDAQVIEQ